MKFLIPIFVCFLIFISFSIVNSESSTPEFELENGYIIVRGVGLVPPNNPTTQGLDLARLAAKLDAQRNLLQIIAELQLSNQVSSISNHQTEQIKIQLDGILPNAEIISESEHVEQDMYHLKMRLAVVNINSSLNSPKNRPIANLPAVTYSSLIIDASHLPSLPKTILEIRDLEGNLIYSATRSLFKDNSIVKDLKADVMKHPVIGKNPLIIPAVGIEVRTLLVKVSDGELILTSLQNSDVFLLSKIAVIIGGSKL